MMSAERELPAKIGGVTKNSPGHNFDLRAKSSWEDFLNIYKKILSGGFCSHVKIVTGQFFVTPPYFCWQLAFCRHHPTLSSNNSTLKARTPKKYHIFGNLWTRALTWCYPWKIFTLKIFGDGPIYENFPFFTKFHFTLVKIFVGLLQTQFWCHRPST